MAWSVVQLGTKLRGAGEDVPSGVTHEEERAVDDDVQMLLKSSEKDPFRKLVDGDFGLRTTYWSFGGASD